MSMRRRLPWLDADPASPFPPVAMAADEPPGLLAAGGDLSPARLLTAYRGGIFPWYSKGDPILWWSPDPRMVFRTDRIHLGSRFRRALRSSNWTIRADGRFAQVIDACATAPRAGQDGTWITTDMRDAYVDLHRLGHAHSVEVLDENDQLVGGLYGVAVGRMFFGESMFSGASGGSKVAIGALAQRLHAWGWPLLDAQVESPHLLRMGAEPWPRPRFMAEVATLVDQAGEVGPWTARFGAMPAEALAG